MIIFENEIKLQKAKAILLAEIDIMVYKLYELTYDEVKIVGSGFDNVLRQFGLTKEDYKQISMEELGKIKK